MLVVALLQATTAAAVVSHAVPSGAVATSIELGGGRAMTVYTPFQDRDAEADAVAAILGVSKEVVSGAREGAWSVGMARRTTISGVYLILLFIWHHDKFRRR